MKAIVTGASSGIGKEIYNWLAQDHEVTGVSRRGPDWALDLSWSSTREAVFKDVQSIDLLINNAGVLNLNERNKGEFQHCIEMIHLNFIAVWHLMELAISHMTEGGNIINIASVSGLGADEEVPLYGATKAGVISLTKSYAKILAENGIRVNCISPGFFDTNLVQGPTPKFLIDEVPLKREAHTPEIISVVDMILKTPYMTGANIVVDGGVSL